MHLARLYDFATSSTTGAVLVLSLPCALILFAVWLAEHSLAKQRRERELEAERQAAAREVQDRKVYDAVSRFRGRG